MGEETVPAAFLETLSRTVARVGSYTDPATLGEMTAVFVDGFGLEGAELWETRDGALVRVCGDGVPVDGEIVARGRTELVDEGNAAAWPLRVGARTVGVLALRGEITRPLRIVVPMLAARCAHILLDTRGAALQRSLLEGLSHELRAPLQSLVGGMDLLLAGAYGPLTDEQRGAAALVARHAEKVLAVAGDVLQVARIDAGRDRPIVGEVDLTALLRREVEDGRALAGDRPLEVRLECPDGLALTTDGAKVSRIVTNLVANAVKYTERGAVTVRGASGPDGGAVVEVADTGPGIPREFLEEIFLEYRRLDPSREGTGLGLAIARRLAGMLGGTLEATSELGAGSRFRLALPSCAG